MATTATRSTPMHRRVFFIVLLLTIGAVINLAIAWGCCVASGRWFAVRTPLMNSNASEQSREQWVDLFGQSVLVSSFEETRDLNPRDVPTSPQFGSMLFFLTESRSTSVGVEITSVLDMLRSIPPHMKIVRAGWPLKSFACEMTSAQFASRMTCGFTIHMPPKPGQGAAAVHLPYRPIALGFAINTSLYAAIAWIIFFALFRWRAMRRRRNGLCVQCAYDLRGMQHEHCPECGAGAPSPV